ncbi:hypothetical protein FLM48_14150 [Shewanella sp. Scap07]|uniref:hypothetical protein n=1 Tax=Shewanella sp. Scap07 TaxID=2589987 RepID=UPI0015C13989|nr:hypothetical protein [Shewanella sp. Scap07]QLE86108.1 hypothetical protein FLM48_14150 [Shewanella sp. Scap07]
MLTKIVAHAHFKFIIAAFSVASVGAAYDFSDRVWVPTSTSNAAVEYGFANDADLLPSYTEEEKAVLIEAFEKYDYRARAKAEEAAKALSKVVDQGTQVNVEIPDIDTQQGELLSLYTKTSKLSLKAVINETTNFALIKQQSHEGKNTKWLKLEQGQSFEGFTVSQLSHTSIKLTRGEQVIQLMMYKRNS